MMTVWPNGKITHHRGQKEDHVCYSPVYDTGLLLLLLLCCLLSHEYSTHIPQGFQSLSLFLILKELYLFKLLYLSTFIRWIIICKAAQRVCFPIHTSYKHTHTHIPEREYETWSVKEQSNRPANAHRRADRLNLFSDKLINLYQLPLAAFSQLPNLLTLNRSVIRENGRPVCWTTRDFTQTISTDDQWNMICMPRCFIRIYGILGCVGANCSLSSSAKRV